MVRFNRILRSLGIDTGGMTFSQVLALAGIMFSTAIVIPDRSAGDKKKRHKADGSISKPTRKTRMLVRKRSRFGSERAAWLDIERRAGVPSRGAKADHSTTHYRWHVPR